ncbi:MAG: DNA-binding response regulator, partial [Lewinella sp.]|nr:DNA-binding response regulator [Lewinella sp.]
TSLGEKYNFVIAQHGKEGLAKARQFLPEVIISDIMMPVMDGLEFCQRIKEDPKTSHITIILLTAKTLESARLEGVRRGADVYLTKPFEVRLLEAHIDNLIQRKKELGEYFRDELMLVQSPPETKNQQDQVFLRKVTDLIEANVGDADFSVEQLSHEIGLSATQLYRKLKEMTGHSAQDLIRKYRIKKASLLLRNSDEHIAQVMYQVGFSSSSYFSKCFKAEFGMTPKAFQRRCQTETGK